MNIRVVRLLLAALLPITVLAQNPVLSSVSPARFFTQSEPTIMRVTLNGKNMWPDYMSITLTTQIMHVHLQKNGRDEVIRGSGIASDRQIIDFSSTGWLNTPGDIELYIAIDEFSGRPAFRSNSVFLHVDPTPATAPVITSLSNSSFKTGEPRDKYYIRIVGKNFGEQRTTSAQIGGYTAPIGWEHLEDGVMDVWVPSEIFSKPGSYGVTVATKYGTSNPATLKIEQPLVIFMAKPATGSKPASTSTNAGMRNIAVASSVGKVAGANDKDVRLKAEVMNGVRITISGIVADGGTRATLENFITGLENVFVVDNQLAIAEANGNINIVLKATGVDKTVTDRIKKQIQDKAAAMNLTVAVSE